ncbi:caspase family protein, partial [Bosea sp. (in: a-proteobacteria)]|uniref:caspase family protein n=1 Tax=Bosea sp. (in: a-proteobacteria) TaxID=1871050 RepID=UPI002733B835
MAAIGSVLALGAGTVLAQVPSAPKRLAFVIGNGAYSAIPPLQNALNDANATRSVLQEAGFEVVPASDATLADLRSALDRFIERVRESGRGTTALVYYAGHAVQLDGTNYLLPIDVRPQRSTDIPAQALPLSDILRRLDGTGAVSKIVVLDACRNNPFATAELSRGLALQLVDGAQDGIRSEAGLARIDSGSGTFVAFSTSPGATAADGAGANSPFTTAFLREIREPGLPVEQLFRRIRLSVHDATGGQQIPWDTSSLITDFAFFQRPATAPATPPAGPATTQGPSLTLRPTAASLRSMAPADAYRAAIAWDRRDIYRATLEAHPDDERALRLHRGLALRTEETAWAETVRAGDAESFRLFARLYPGS